MSTSAESHSNLDFAWTMSDPGRAFRNAFNSSFFTMFRNQGQSVQEPIDPSEGAFGFDKWGSLSIPENSNAPVLMIPLQVLKHPQFHAEIRQIAQEEAERIFALEAITSLIKAVPEAL